MIKGKWAWGKKEVLFPHEDSVINLKACYAKYDILLYFLPSKSPILGLRTDVSGRYS